MDTLELADQKNLIFISSVLGIGYCFDDLLKVMVNWDIDERKSRKSVLSVCLDDDDDDDMFPLPS